jgi:hypothetical protein
MINIEVCVNETIPHAHNHPPVYLGMSSAELVRQL